MDNRGCKPAESGEITSELRSCDVVCATLTTSQLCSSINLGLVRGLTPAAIDDIGLPALILR